MKEPRYGWIPGKEDWRPLSTLLDCALYAINIRMTCNGCGHSRVMDGPGLWWLAERKGWDQSLHTFGKRCYCGECWRLRYRKQRWPKMEQTKEPAEGALLPSPDQRTWKRVINRQRS